LSPHHANAWIARLKLLAGVPAPVVLLCSGSEPLTNMPPPVVQSATPNRSSPSSARYC
jgi:hypothetical protein